MIDPEPTAGSGLGPGWLNQVYSRASPCCFRQARRPPRGGPGADQSDLDPSAGVHGRLGRRATRDAAKRHAGQDAEAALTGRARGAQPEGVPAASKHVAQVPGPGTDGLLQHDDVGIVPGEDVEDRSAACPASRQDVPRDQTHGASGRTAVEQDGQLAPKAQILGSLPHVEGEGRLARAASHGSEEPEDAVFELGARSGYRGDGGSSSHPQVEPAESCVAREAGPSAAVVPALVADPHHKGRQALPAGRPGPAASDLDPQLGIDVEVDEAGGPGAARPGDGQVAEQQRGRGGGKKRR